MTKSAFDKLTPAEREIYRQQCAKGGKNGAHADKVKAGQAGFRARVKKIREQLAGTHRAVMSWRYYDE